MCATSPKPSATTDGGQVAGPTDTDRLAMLREMLHWDGRTFWLPGLHVAAKPTDTAQDAMPTLDALRAAIDRCGSLAI